MSITGFNRRRREAAQKAASKPAQAPQVETGAKVQPEPEQPADSDSKPKRGRPRKSQE